MLRYIVFFVLNLIAFSPLAGQSIDSIETMLKNNKINISERIDLLNILSREYTFINTKKTLDYANEALELSIKTQNKKGIAYAYRNLSNIYTNNEIYFYGMEYIQKALVVFQEIGDSTGIANCYISLGHTYRGLHNLKQEVYYHKRSFEHFLHLNIPDRIGVAAHNLGESYFNNHEYDKCKELTLYAIRINDSIGNISVLSSCYKVMGNMEFAQNNYQQAENYFKKVLELSEKLGKKSQKIATVQSMIKLIAIYQKKGESELQLYFLNKVVEFCKQHHLLSYLPSIYGELILYYSERKNLDKVQKYVIEYKSISDSISSASIKDKADFVNSLVHFYDLEKEKQVLERNKILQAESINRRNMLLVVSLFFSLILIWMIIRISGAHKKIKTTNQILTNQNSTIEEQKANLIELNNTKDKFFSIVAHDLRSPIGSLKSFSSMLVEQIDNFSKEEISYLSKELNNSVDNTLKMIDNLLEWAKIQMKQYDYNPEKMPVTDIITNICQLYTGIANNKEIDLNCSIEDGLTVFGDRHQISFIVRNLVNNAIKYTNIGGKVELFAKSTPKGEVLISVSDNGIGISKDLKNSLFSLIKNKSNAGTAGEYGTGLGLMLSYEFIKLNNGYFEIESEEGKGSNFKIIFKNENFPV